MTQKKQKVLFVCYGLSHSKITHRVYSELIKEKNVDISLLALTIAQDYFLSENIPFFGYKDFFPLTEEIRKYGDEIIASMKTPPQNTLESQVYLGVNFLELVQDLGEKKAWDRYKKLGRASFLPIRAMEEVIKKVNPDVLVTTNSPRSESASIIAARKLGVPTVSIVDLFGVYEAHFLQADYLCVPFQTSKDILQPKVPSHCKIIVTGSTLFNKGRLNKLHRKKHLLWCEQPCFRDRSMNKIFRNESDVLTFLSDLKGACHESGWVLTVRLHPQQQNKDFTKSLRSEGIEVDENERFESTLGQFETVGSYGSTALVEAALSNRNIIKYQPDELYNGLPLEREFESVHVFKTPKELANILTNMKEPTPYHHISPDEAVAKIASVINFAAASGDM